MMKEDDDAQAEADRWIRENDEFAAKARGAGGAAKKADRARSSRSKKGMKNSSSGIPTMRERAWPTPDSCTIPG